MLLMRQAHHTLRILKGSRESELYPTPKLKNEKLRQHAGRTKWGLRLVHYSMRDYVYDFETDRQGLATLENTFIQLSRDFSEYKNINESPVDVATILQESTAVSDLELESMGRYFLAIGIHQQVVRFSSTFCRSKEQRGSLHHKGSVPP